MDDDILTPKLPDGVEPDEAAALESTWRALGAIDAPPPPSDRMRARLDEVMGAVHGSKADPSALAEAAAHKPRVIAFRMKGSRAAMQALAAAAMLLVGIAIGRYSADPPVRGAGTADGGPTRQDGATQI